MDFDKVTISKDGKDLASMAPTIGDDGGAVGGSIVCLDQFGKIAVALTGGGEEPSAALAGGNILIRNGMLWLVNSKGASRVRILDGDQLASEDGGTILLQAADDIQADKAAIVLSASKRSLVINGTDGNPIFKIDPSGNLLVGGSQGDGDLFLRDKSGKIRVRLGATEQSLQLLAADGKQVANLGTNGDLVLGGGGVDGDIVLKDESGNIRIRLGAHEHRLVLIDAAGKMVANLGTNGDLHLEGKLISNGNIVTTKGNLRRQRITERSRKVDRNMILDLFPAHQDGSFVIELAASFGLDLGDGSVRFGTYYASWSVVTHKDLPEGHRMQVAILSAAQDSSSQTEAFWQEGMDPAFLDVSGNVRLIIGEVADQGFKVPLFLNNATLCVRALYGRLLDF